MEAASTRKRTPVGRWVELAVVVVAVLASFTAGVLYDHRSAYTGQPPPRADRPVSPPPSPVETEPDLAYDPATAFPQVDRSVPAEPPRPEPRAVEARAKAIAADAEAIRDQCRQSARGDWARWQRDTKPYRATLKARIDRLSTSEKSGALADGRFEPLEGRDDFPLFELNPRVHLNYLCDPASLDSFRKERPVVAARRWLARRGIDLIFVPVPKMTEVYVQHFVDDCPADGVIAPHVRQALLEMLEADVEVVDLARLFRGLADDGDPEYLYNTCDTHWAPRGMRAAAKEIADRIARYRFGSRARLALPIFRTTPGPHELGPYLGGLGSAAGWQALTPAQQARARAAQTTQLSQVLTLDGEPVKRDPHSPVLVIGHSYVRTFQDQLAKELNLPVHVRSTDGQTTGFFADFLREPEILKNCRVVVWVTTEQHMTHFEPLPPPVRAAMDK